MTAAGGTSGRLPDSRAGWLAVVILALLCLGGLLASEDAASRRPVIAAPGFGEPAASIRDSGSAPPVVGVWALAWEKTGQVGGNRRWDEAAAVVEQLTHRPFGLMVGEGWGALIANPAVGGQRVSFTHSFVSYLLFKTGLIGVAAVTCYLAVLAPLCLRAVRRRPDLGLAALAPLAAGLTVHTGFKYLCFGVLLTLLTEAGRTACPAGPDVSATYPFTSPHGGRGVQGGATNADQSPMRGM